jgi:hypothetical protein
MPGSWDFNNRRLFHTRTPAVQAKPGTHPQKGCIAQKAEFAQDTRAFLSNR